MPQKPAAGWGPGGASPDGAAPCPVPVPVSGTFHGLVDGIGYQAVSLAVDLGRGPGLRCLD